MSSQHSDYSKPQVEEYGSVESITEQLDKIGGQDDGIDYEGLDGSIQPDSS